MINFLNKILNFSKKNYKDNFAFKEIEKKTKVNKIFNAINEFSDQSEIRYVGGCIRKILQNEIVDDIDLSTNLTPKDVCKALNKKNIKFYETGIEHGTITALIDKTSFEITSLRKDVSTDGRHAKVAFTNDWLEDASRRDFTINSIYADMNGNFFDPFNGKMDLENGNVKFIGNPDKRLKEDYLRILRYIRFYINYSKTEHDQATKKSIRQNISGVSLISRERLLQELKKLILSKNFIKIEKDEFLKEILLLIFPQLKNLNKINNLNEFSKKIFCNKDFVFLISFMIIDGTDNTDYFLYKYNLSNEEKEKINFLKNMSSKDEEKNFYSEKNLWKIFYKYNKNYLIDLIDFKIFKSSKVDKKLLNLKNFFLDKSKPLFPIKAKDLMNKYNYKEGVELGKKLKELENFWLNNNFNLSKEDIDKLVKN
tara:strand:- start:15582 stop:16856 length:1275 start_codon:yes stop_codon:yes gene_type:complete